MTSLNTILEEESSSEERRKLVVEAAGEEELRLARELVKEPIGQERKHALRGELLEVNPLKRVTTRLHGLSSWLSFGIIIIDQ
jgi:hypothetical protein